MCLAALAGAGVIARHGPARAAKPFTPPDQLLEAARKEGQMTLYSATFTEVQQDVIAAFNKRFPFVKVNFVRASGGQLITRVKTEAASGKLEADVIDHSDRGQTFEIADLFADYAPPNAADYLPAALVSPKLWPTLTPALVDRMEYRAGEESAEILDGPDETRIHRANRAGNRTLWRNDLDPYHV